MLARRIFVLLIAAVLVGRTLHCCHVEASLAASPRQTGDAGNPPLKNPHDSDPNETGCICKGAVVNAPTALAAVRSALEGFNPLANAPQSAALAISATALESRPTCRHLLGPPPLGGKALRAWVGSLLI